jgi:hypothetical protein
LLQGYDSNPWNSKGLVHQACLDMIKLSAPTHELKKSNFGDKKEITMFSRINQNEEVLFKSIMVVSNSTSPSEVSSKIKFANMCQDGSSLCNLLWHPSMDAVVPIPHKKNILLDMRTNFGSFCNTFSNHSFSMT